jgi:hypothetical protein
MLLFLNYYSIEKKEIDFLNKTFLFFLFFTELFVDDGLGDDCIFALLIVDDSGDLIELATGEPLAVDIGV